MKKIKVVFPDGSVGEIDENDLQSALSAGAKRYEEKSVKTRKVTFADGSEGEIDEADYSAALSSGALKKKESAGRDFLNASPFTFPGQSGGANVSGSAAQSTSTVPGFNKYGQPEFKGTGVLTDQKVSRNPYANILSTLSEADIDPERRKELYNQVIDTKNVTPLIDLVKEEKEKVNKKKEEYKAKKTEGYDNGLTGADDLIMATQVPDDSEVFKTDDERIKNMQRFAAKAVDDYTADKFLGITNAKDQLYGAKAIGEERRKMLSDIGEEVGYKDEVGNLDYANKFKGDDGILKLYGFQPGTTNIAVDKLQQFHDYKNEFGIFSASIVKLGNDLDAKYNDDSLIKEYYETNDEARKKELSRVGSVASFIKDARMYDALNNRLNELSDNYPQVQIEQKRNKIADAWANIVHSQDEAASVNPSPIGGPSGLQILRQVRKLFVGDRPDTEDEYKQIADATGMPQEDVKAIIESPASKDIDFANLPSRLGRVWRSATGVMNSAGQGMNRLFLDKNKADLINNQLDKINYQPPAASRKEWNVDRVFDTMANGFGQFVGFVGTGGIASLPAKALVVAPLEAAAVSETANSVIAALQKANNIGSTFATGYASSLEDAYRYAATQTDDEEKRWQYAQADAIANGASELLLRDIDVAEKILKGKNATKILDDFMKTRTPFTSGDVFKARLGEFAKVLGYESAEELIPYFTDIIAKDNIFGYKTSTAEVMKGALDTVIETAISTVPMGGFSASSVPTTRVFNTALLEAAKTPEKFIGRWNQMFDDGKIGEAERDKNIKTVNTIADIYNKLPDELPNGKKLSEQDKASIINLQLGKRQLEDMKAKVDDSLHPSIDEEIVKKSQQISAVINEPVQRTQQDELRIKADELQMQANSLPPEQMEEKKVMWAQSDELRRQANEIDVKESLPKVADEERLTNDNEIITFQKVQTSGKKSFTDLFIDRTKPKSSMQALKEQAVDAPNGLLQSLNEDTDTLTDLISLNDESAINDSIAKWEDRIVNMPDATTAEQKAEADVELKEIENNLSLLKEGLAKKQAQQKSESIGQEFDPFQGTVNDEGNYQGVKYRSTAGIEYRPGNNKEKLPFGKGYVFWNVSRDGEGGNFRELLKKKIDEHGVVYDLSGSSSVVRNSAKKLIQSNPEYELREVKSELGDYFAIGKKELFEKQKPITEQNGEQVSQVVGGNSNISVIQPSSSGQNVITRRGVTVSTPQSEMDKFVDRMAKGEVLSTPEDLQFYNNNATEIESRLRDRLKQEADEEVVIPTPEEEERKRMSDALFAFADKILKADPTGSGGSSAMTNLFKIPQEILGRALQLVAAAVKGGELFSDAIQKGIDYIRGEGHQVDADDFTGLVNSISRGEKPKMGTAAARAITIDKNIPSDQEYMEQAMNENEPDDAIAAYHMTRGDALPQAFGADLTQQAVFDSLPSEEKFRTQMDMLSDGKNLIAAAQAMFGSVDVNSYGRKLFQYIQKMSDRDAGLTNKKAVLLATLLGEIKQALYSDHASKSELQQLDRVVSSYYNRFMHVTAKNLAAGRLLRLFRDKYMADVFADKIMEEEEIKMRNSTKEAEADVNISDEDAAAHQEKKKEKTDTKASNERRNKKQKEAKQRKASSNSVYEKRAKEKEDDINSKYGGKNKLVETIIQKIKDLNCK